MMAAVNAKLVNFAGKSHNGYAKSGIMHSIVRTIRGSRAILLAHDLEERNLSCNFEVVKGRCMRP